MSDVNLPESWQEIPLGSLGIFFRGQGGTRSDESHNGLPCIRYGDLYTHHGCIVKSFCSAIEPDKASSYTPLKSGDIVFAGSGETSEEIGKAAAYCGQDKVYAGGDTIIFRPRSNLDSYFAGYAVNSNHFAKHKSRLGQGSSVIHISAEYLASIPLRLPPVQQQQTIATVLQTIDRTIAHTEALIEKYQQIKAGLMHDLFTRGIGSDGKLRPPREQAPELYQESAIGWIPREWEVKLLGKLCNITSGGTPNRSKSNFWGGSIPWIKTGEIKYGKIEKSEEHITKEGLNSSSAKLFCKGTVVMAIYGEGNTRGRVAILGIDCASNQACVGFEFNGLIESQFMYFLFEYKYHDLRDMSNDGSQKNLSSSLLKSMDISFPRCKDEQVRITNCLLSINKKIEQEKETRSKLNKQKSGLMHDLLTGKVPVTVEPDENRA
ncbi:restriction endonuclease subunit S [Prochlorothrix hollandica]|uniref:restriction endonuclease subunit S n=1 Tax=Prochlorothrix hollandica TaxID=1223 RepID=UPI00036AC29A|nr:restriction endonuclease subunit S [Prochlorothrix hollandica]